MHGGTAGAGQRLRPVRRRDALHRFLYVIEHPGPQGDRLDHIVEIDLGRDLVLAVPAALEFLTTRVDRIGDLRHLHLADRAPALAHHHPGPRRRRRRHGAGAHAAA
jgi:hypothetical protein